MKPTIGIEVHVELKTMAKAFSLSKNNFNDEANTNINVLDLGYPGTLPRLNKGIIDFALKACLAFNCKSVISTSLSSFYFITKYYSSSIFI